MAKKLSLEELIRFNTELRAIVKSRIPVDAGLKTLAKEMDGRLKNFVEDIARRISKGESISEALSQRDDALEAYYISLVKAGEVSGNLEKVLLELVKNYRKSLMVRRNIHSAIRYPMIIFGLILIVFYLIETRIIPRMVDIYAQFGVELPSLTRFFVSISYILVRNIYLPFLVIIVCIIIYLWSIHLPSRRAAIDYLKVRLPFIGKLIYFDMIASFAKNLSNLLSQKIPIDTALVLTRGSLPYYFGKKFVDEILRKMNKGMRMSEALENNYLIPPSNIWMIKISEERGDLPDVLNDIADYYEERYNNLRDTVIPYLEPVLILLFGVLVGFMVISLYLPLFNAPMLIR